MQAQADLNADSSALLKQENSFKNAQADLNRLLASEANIPVNVSGNIEIDRTLTFDNLNEKVKSQNTELLIAKQNERLADLTIDQARSGRYPQLSLFGGYNYTRNTAAIGFAQLSRSYGPTYGATFSWNIYGAGATNRNVQNAKIQRISQQIQRQDLESQLNSELYKMYNQYQVNVGLVTIEQQNMKVTEKNVAVALERYKVGAFTDLELKDVQTTFLEASSRLLSTLYEAKQSETELLRMSGQLVK
jgi:outer membrane protein TolC